MGLLGLGIGLMGGGIGLQAYIRYMQGQMGKQMYDWNRAVSLRYARAVREIRAYEKFGFWREAAKIFPKQKVITAAAGLEISGTPLKVMKATRMKLEEQAKIMEMETEMEISQIETGAAISGMRGRLEATSGTYGAFATLLTGGGQLALMGYKYA